MIKVKVSTIQPEWPLIRQTPGAKGIWGNCQFFINEEIYECDWWIVYEGLLKPEKIKCPKSNTILITGEPPSIKTYNQDFINQFAQIITCHRNIKHPNVIYSQQALPWMIGAKFIAKEKRFEKDMTKNYDDLIDMHNVNKTKLISVISSNKNYTEGHKERLLFIKQLKKVFGGNIDIYGVGIRDIVDKWDGIAPYRYNICLENSRIDDYWTEKLSDCILCQSYPFYSGCTNIENYFDSMTMTIIDIDKPLQSISLIRSVINNNFYEKSLANIKNAKVQILNKYNFFPMMYTFINKRQNKLLSESIIIEPESKSVDNRMHKSLLTKLKNKLLQ